MSTEFSQEYSIGYRAGLQAAMDFMESARDAQQECRYGVDPIELAIEHLTEEIATTVEERPVSVGPMPDMADTEES